MPSTNETQRMVVTGINIKTTGVTALFNPSQQQFFVTNVRAIYSAASSIAVGPTLSLGTTTGSNIDLCASVALGLTAVNTGLDMTLLSGRPVIPIGTAVNLNISVAATGTSGTLTIILEGFYF